MMTPHLTFTLNEKKIVHIALDNLDSTLEYVKEDVELYFFMLAVISKEHPTPAKRSQAFKYLIKQDKLQYILDDLIARQQLLVSRADNALATNDEEQKEITCAIQQLKQELAIFNELHFKVKRTHIRFTNEHFRADWGQSYMVA